MNRRRVAIGIVVTGIALSAPLLGAGSAGATPVSGGCHSGDRMPTSDPHTYDSCIEGEWGNLRQCPPFTVVAQAVDGDVRCVNE
ncbi:hypothetical protein ACWELJ_19960 [Nocardia sp. NPDC004582]